MPAAYPVMAAMSQGRRGRGGGLTCGVMVQGGAAGAGERGDQGAPLPVQARWGSHLHDGSRCCWLASPCHAGLLTTLLVCIHQSSETHYLVVKYPSTVINVGCYCVVSVIICLLVCSCYTLRLAWLCQECCSGLLQSLHGAVPCEYVVADQAWSQTAKLRLCMTMRLPISTLTSQCVSVWCGYWNCFFCCRA